jgi:hypothetical protein
MAFSTSNISAITSNKLDQGTGHKTGVIGVQR